MDNDSRQQLFHLLSSVRLGALGTNSNSKPRVAMVSIAPAEDFSVFYIHISRLAQHTRDILKDNRLWRCAANLPGTFPTCYAAF